MNARPEQLQFFTPTVVVRQPDGSLLARAGSPELVPGGDFIGTMEAGKILRLSQRRVNAMCDEGIFEEGRDWVRPGGPRGNYHLRRASVLRMLGQRGV